MVRNVVENEGKILERKGDAKRDHWSAGLKRKGKVGCCGEVVKTRLHASRGEEIGK